MVEMRQPESSNKTSTMATSDCVEKTKSPKGVCQVTVQNTQEKQFREGVSGHKP